MKIIINPEESRDNDRRPQDKRDEDTGLVVKP